LVVIAGSKTTMFGRSVPLFRLAGFQVGIDWSWLILAVLITWTLASGVFPQSYPGLTPGLYLAMGVIAALGLFASIVLHELAHSLVARRHGVPIRGITLFIFGGVAQMDREPDRPGAEFRVAIAGPIASFLVGLAYWLLARAAASLGAGVPVVGVLAYLASINVILAVFNLVPAFPLDGGRILRAVLWYWNGSLRWATRVASWIGGAFGIVLIALGVWQALVGGDRVGGMWFALIGLFVYAAAQASYQQVVLREGLRGVPVRQIMTADPIAVPPGITIAQLIDDYVYRHRHNMFPVVENGRLVGCIGMNDIKRLPRDRWPSTTVSDIMQPCAEATALSPDTDAMEALQLMSRTQNGRFLVVDRDRLVGIVTLKDILKFLSTKLELEQAERVDPHSAATSPQERGLSQRA
jgi:Zn-dependent protease/predicted transcriptional regulator